MTTVREWEYTSRFGHLGRLQNSQANNARVLEYFSDSYPNPKEALYKAEVFLSISDYIGRHAAFFVRKDLVEELAGSVLAVGPALLRAVHYAFSASPHAAGVPPKRILTLARAFAEVERSL